MFSLYCPVADAEVLRGPRAVLSMHNTSEGIVSYVVCSCGAVAIMVTGQLADEPRIVHPELAEARPTVAADCA